MRASHLLACAVALVATDRTAVACGPDFPVHLLSDRRATLEDLEDGVFTIEAEALVPPPAHKYTIVGDDPYGVRERGGAAEKRIYDEGAKAFADGDLETAIARFEAVLALPAAERQHRSTWAAYMLGRSHRWGSRAAAAYQRVRALVGDGFLDERGLAASSLGQEARVWLAEGNLSRAVKLYAEQAAAGHPDGALSLLQIARDAMDSTTERARLLANPIGQQLVGAYLYTRSHELDAATHAKVWRELAALPSPAGADRLAAAAYRAGNWDLAARLAKQADSPLARWVKAKLALRDGDHAIADRLLASVEDRLADPGGNARVTGERVVLAVAAGRMTDAMEGAWRVRGDYPFDACYVAERLLTLDELHAFVDSPAADASASDELWATCREPREVLARRLMRAGKLAEALPYFTRGKLVRARAFTSALDRAEHARDPIDRARALFDASVAARVDGLEILGTSHAPDWGMLDAQFSLDDYETCDHERERFRPADFEWDATEDIPCRPSHQPSADPLVGKTERARVEASAPAMPQRYHYRLLASRLAEQAADLLPHQSHAFAATLCHAARYARNVDEARVDKLYRRYLNEGPMVEFSTTFADECPEPEFERARRFLDDVQPDAQPARAKRASAGIGRTTWFALLAGALILVGAICQLRNPRFTTFDR